MKNSKRYNLERIEDDLNSKMVLLSGPRQVGKTTLAHQIPQSFYMNWDISEDREK